MTVTEHIERQITYKLNDRDVSKEELEQRLSLFSNEELFIINQIYRESCGYYWRSRDRKTNEVEDWKVKKILGGAKWKITM